MDQGQDMLQLVEMKGIIFPLVGIFVGVAALNYAMGDLNKPKSFSTVYNSELD